MLITVGSFDGFHRGHEKLFEVCRENSRNGDWGVATFYPHPSEYMGKLPHALFTLNERGFLCKIFDVPRFIVFEFDEAFRNLSPEEFIDMLIKNFNVDGIVAGSDFHFGRGRLGSADYLERIYKDRIKIFRLGLLDKNVYSSSQARKKILAGDVAAVREILGYSFFMISDVVHGNARGRTMKFPTANINLSGRIVPAYGVYATAVLIDGSWHCGALSVGNNPTFHDVNETRAEVFITDFDGDIYGSELLICFLDRLRGIKTFETQADLMAQIADDVRACEDIFNDAIGSDRFLGRAAEIYSSQKNFEPKIINIKSCL
ncbi:MAG: riboflavin biosynthesis protein RibF [Synergistaceae bacterium]|nr:riboflavin biosynthesis protein RibF [Synergistaceae bacterium]